MLNYIKNKRGDLSRCIHKFIFVSTLVLFSSMGSAADDSSKTGDSVRGAKEWANNCSRCHNMRDPKDFRDDSWKQIVAHMRVRAGLTGQQARDILAFLQSSNYVVTVSDSGFVKVTNTPSASGESIYKQTCVACHGPNGEGAIPGVPKFNERLSKSDDVLLTNIKNGFQSEGSPMAMPAKGGNASLTDADLQEVLLYLRQNFGQ
jgi:mono/diheme cytochrome c family protein